ncbi:malonate decarboxylase holo-[acyl-carrier-protein] synthase [Duganella sp. FT94W]|uniref:Malonate decarboxylase holo-[acyl-carrier-protein] synthase n=1 Tax=Duganella lactea TaxID=2692173 RepID=A0ABW9V7A4_9BURK|nr:malonate decarboxylase holo-[acyl-carrier-protein] synthase [Duganella lactea]MYM34650.1 malonate decarboxylase holo-[acyl-carrier-protein] synthase [Duganella lactea]
MSSELERHALVWLTAAGWDAAIAAARPEHASALTQWRQHDWPAVVRRHDSDAAAMAYAVCLGVPLPPDAAGIKVRIPLRVASSHIARTSPPLELRSTLTTAGAWRDELTSLCDAAPGLRVFGSLAMQTLTGLPYVSPTSDVDLLFHPTSRQQLAEIMALLARHADSLPLDGEVVFPGGAAVSWKEWRMAITHPAKVMVKELRSVRLADTESLLAMLEAA